MDALPVLLIDLENVVGAVRPAPQVIRSRVGALLAAGGRVHHAVAGYAVAEPGEDPTASVLAELGVSSLPVARRKNAAEHVMIGHAKRVHRAVGCSFLVASADGLFAGLADLAPVEVLIWQDQPVATKLVKAARHVHRLPRPDTVTEASPAPVTKDDMQAGINGAEHHMWPIRSPLFAQALTALVIGVGIGVGHRLVDALLARRRTRDRR